MKPKFMHDCERCTFLGQYRGLDLYFCDQGGVVPTVIARYGDDGPEYASGMPNSHAWPEGLREARRLATERGLLEKLG